MAVRTNQRRDEIVRVAQVEGTADVQALADRFEVSASTIRRDLATLNDAGRLMRVHGGAVPGSRDAGGVEPSLRQRIGEDFEAKQAIARWCAAQIEPGEHVVLDAGSTVAALAHELRGRRDLVVCTTSLGVLDEVRGSGLEVRCTGGSLREVSQAFVGPITEAVLDRMTFDRAFLGADSVDARRGICEADLQQARLKELMAGRSRTTYVLAHESKLGRSPFHAWARLPQGWTLVTDTSGEQLDPFRSEGIRTVDATAADQQRPA
ncbi:DeoR/GlpR family DNA-binding transcription regulator [Dermacoccaceae bacterium W4C1]